MITVIGYSKTVIGMGLTGVQKVHEINDKTSAEEILKIISDVDSEFIIIDEEIFNKVRKGLRRSKKRFIKMPNPKGGEVDPIDDIVRDTIGVSIRS